MKRLDTYVDAYISTSFKSEPRVFCNYIFFRISLYNYWGKLPMYIRRSKKNAFLIIEQKISCSFADVCNPRRRRPKISFNFIHSWVSERERNLIILFMTVMNIFFYILLMHQQWQKGLKGDGNNYFGYIYFFLLRWLLFYELNCLKDIASHDDPLVLLDDY